MVSKVFVSSSWHQQPTRIRPRPKPSAAVDDMESLSTLGMNDVSMPTERALHEMRSPPPLSKNPPRLIVTPRTNNHSNGLGSYTRQSATVDRVTHCSRRSSISRPSSRQHQAISTRLQPTVLQTRQHTLHLPSVKQQHQHHHNLNDQSARHKTKKKHKTSKKYVIRDPRLQAALDAALDRLKERRQCEGSTAPSSHMQSAIDHIIHIDEMQHHPSLHLPDLHYDEVEYEEKSYDKSRRDRHYRTGFHPEEFPLDQEFTDMRELRDIVEIFSEYGSILDHLVQKHSRLLAYVEGADNLPEEFHTISHEVKRRLAKMRIERRDKRNAAKKGQYTKIQSRNPRTSTIKQQSYEDVRRNTSRQSPASYRAVQQESRRSTPLPEQSLRKSVSNLETRRDIKSQQTNPKKAAVMRYGRNEGFIHGSKEQKIEASNSGHIATNHHRNFLYRAHHDEEREPPNNKKEKRATTPLRSKRADGHPSYEKSARIQKLREELEHLRKQRKASPYRSKQSIATTKADPVPSHHIAKFSRPATASNLDPGGERYNDFTKAETIQPAEATIGRHLDAPGKSTQEMAKKERESQLLHSAPRIKGYRATPEHEQMTAQNEKIFGAASNESQQVYFTGFSDDEKDTPKPSTSLRIRDDDRKKHHDKKPLRKLRMSPSLPEQRKRIEEIERMVVESKSNELDKELEKEILKMGPFSSEESLSFSEELSGSSNGSDCSSGSDYKTDSSVESKPKRSEDIVNLARPYRYTIGKVPSSESKESSTMSHRKVRRAELLRRIIHNRDGSAKDTSADRAHRLSKLMPEPTHNQSLEVPPVSAVPKIEHAILPNASSLSSTDDQDHFLPVSPSNRGRWQSFARVAPEESFDLLPSFSDRAKQFFARVDIFNSFSQDLQGDNGVHEKKAVSFDTMSERVKQSQIDECSEFEDNHSSDFGLDIQMVESEDGVIHVQVENDMNTDESDMGFEMSWYNEEESTRYDDFGDGPVEQESQRLKERQEHYLQLSPSYKEHQNEADATNNGTLSHNDSDSAISEAAECRYTPAAREKSQHPTWNPPKEIFSTSQDEEPSRIALRQVSKSLLSCNSSIASTQNTTSESTGTALDLLPDDSEDEVDRYMPQTGLGNNAKERDRRPDPDSSVETAPKTAETKLEADTSVIQPPSIDKEDKGSLDSSLQLDQKQDQIQPKHDPPTKMSLFEHDKPQEKPPTNVVASPKGAALAQQTNESSWLNPFGFWG